MPARLPRSKACRACRDCHSDVALLKLERASMLAVRKLIGNAAAPASVLATVITFITDVLQPLGNFAPWVAGVSLLTAIGSGLVYVRHWRKPGVDRLEHPLLG